ncbi:MAG: rhomboid family intramembrane serine protease [Anaerolineae bacterium]|nr:rhomboid family intramembrane serine protease [Anaerolineae bacterium]
MIPIGDVNPRRRTPYMTYLFILINILVFLWELSLSQRELLFAFRDHAVVPAIYTPFSQESLLDGLRSMFMHGGWLHLGSNMLYLWVFGDNVEDHLGSFLYALVYIASGYMAVFAQVMVNTDSMVPMVGASGAIAGVLGAYIVQFPAARIRSLVVLIIFVTVVDLPAFLVLGFWFVSQLFSGVASLGPEMMSGGVAFFAHIGGFVAGMVFMSLYNVIVAPEPRPAPTFEPQPRLILPEERLTPQQAARRQSLIRLLAMQGSRPLEIMTRSQHYFGTVVGISRNTVTLRDLQAGILQIPLDEIVEVV